MKNLVSVVITNYNYSEYVSDAIKSAINQDYEFKEIIVVDDGSTDNSIEVITRFRSQVKLIRKENGGISSARNAGFIASRGSYIAYLDADDYWEPSKLSKQIAILQRSKNQLTYCRMRLVDVDSKNEKISEESRTGDFKVIFQKEPGRTPFAPSSVLMTHQLASQVGEWDTRLLKAAEDYDFYRRCSLVTNIEFLDEILVRHREHSRSLSAGPLSIYYQGNLRALVKMLTDVQAPLKFTQKREAIFRFQLSFGKAYLKNRQFFRAIKLLISVLAPVRHFILVSQKT